MLSTDPIHDEESRNSVYFRRNRPVAWQLKFHSTDAGDTRRHEEFKEETKGMLETIIVLLLILWLIGLVTSNTFGGVLHLLLLVAVVVFIIRLLTGRRAV